MTSWRSGNISIQMREIHVEDEQLSSSPPVAPSISKKQDAAMLVMWTLALGSMLVLNGGYAVTAMDGEESLQHF